MPESLPGQYYLWDCLLTVERTSSLRLVPTEAGHQPADQLLVQSTAARGPAKSQGQLAGPDIEEHATLPTAEESAAWQDTFAALFESEGSEEEEDAAADFVSLSASCELT